MHQPIQQYLNFRAPLTHPYTTIRGVLLRFSCVQLRRRPSTFWDSTGSGL